jgi:hypothetical protein
MVLPRVPSFLSIALEKQSMPYADGTSTIPSLPDFAFPIVRSINSVKEHLFALDREMKLNSGQLQRQLPSV